MRSRPIGVTILAGLVVILGLVNLCGGLIDLVNIFDFNVLGGVTGIIWGFLYLLFGWALWRLKAWARTGTMVLSIFYLIFMIIALFTPPPVNWVGVIISVGILFYMTRPRIKASFK
jgi:uncharacterized membrane protein (DUF2068 family)